MCSQPSFGGKEPLCFGFRRKAGCIAIVGMDRVSRFRQRRLFGILERSLLREPSSSPGPRGFNSLLIFLTFRGF